MSRFLRKNPGTTLITGGTFNNAERDLNIFQTHSVIDIKEPVGIELLRKNVASGAFHNSAERFDPPKCHPHTREAVLKEIMDWVRETDKQQLLLWLYGPAGAGKSSIAHTIAEMCKEAGLLAADFFFSRTASERNHDRYLIATIVYQLTLSIPELRREVASAVEHDPLIFSRSISAQVQALIIEPFSKIRNVLENEEIPGLVVIDGLDECSDARSQSNVITALGQAHIPLFFLIASRPEHAIRNAFNVGTSHSNMRPLVLDNTYEPDADIRLFLRSRFGEIRKQHPSGSSFPPSWPSSAKIEKLVEKSSGQFIYASTVMKFVEEPGYWPDDRVNIVFGLLPPGNNTPFAELDAFYTHILSSVKDFDKVRMVFYFLIFTETRVKDKSPNRIEKFLNFRPGELQTILCDLHSILFVPPDRSARSSFNGTREPVIILHASLPDFLMDKARSKKFFLDAGDAHAHLAECYMRIVGLERGYKQDYLYLDYHFFLDIELDSESILNHIMMATSPQRSLVKLDFAAYLRDRLNPDTNAVTDPAYSSEPLREVSRMMTFGRSNISKFLQWTEKEQNTRDYLKIFDTWILSQLDRYTKSAFFFHVLTAFTISTSRKDCVLLAEVLKLGHSHLALECDTVMNVDPDALGFIASSFLEDEPAQAEAIIVLSAFFQDRERSGEYCITESRYIALAKVFLQFLGNANPNVSNKWASVSSHEIDIDKRSLDILNTILSKVSADRAFGIFLRNNPIHMEKRFERISEEFNSLSFTIAGYIRKCARSSSDPVDAPTETYSRFKLPVPVQITLSPSLTSLSWPVTIVGASTGRVIKKKKSLNNWLCVT